MSEPASRTVEQSVWIDARRETVWKFLVDPERLREWWGDAELEAQPGGRIRVRMQGGPRPTMRGEIVEVTPFERLVFTFGWEDTPGAPRIPPGSSRVEMVLIEDGAGTILQLRHSGLPPALAGEAHGGWLSILPGLAAAAGLRRPRRS